MTRSPQLRSSGRLLMSSQSFSRFSISTRVIPELRAKIDADLRGSSAFSIHCL
jgi:hypothetical protein